MKIKNILLLSYLLALCSCAYWKSGTRKPGSAEFHSMGLIEKSQNIVDRVGTRDFNSQSCLTDLDAMIEAYSKVPDNINLEIIKAQGQEILDESFEARLALHSMLDVLPQDCRVKVKELYLKMRMAEDYIGVHFYAVPQISADTLDYSKEPIPVFEADKYNPYHVGSGIDPKGKFEFKNGDIMITKGKSFISSTISEIATPKSLFSHIVFVHVDETTKEVSTIESYIGKGVATFPIDEALKNENVRILVLRPKDSVMAAKAANYMFDKVMKLKAKNKVIPYDYALDFSNNLKLSCEEVAYDAFKYASDGAMSIPENESQILLDDESFLKRVGIKKGPMMVPTDMETDSRFDVVLDWTDYRVMRDSWRKDALLGEMFRWIQEYDYRIYENLTSIGAKIIWATRNIPGLWNITSKLAGIPKDFTKDVPSITITTMASLKGIAGKMLPVVTRADQEYFEKNGKWMTSVQLRKVLDDFRQTNPKDMRKIFRER